MLDLILRDGISVLSSDKGPLVTPCDIGIKDGIIAELKTKITTPSAQSISLKGLHVLPGLIDTQVHLREPGLEHKETLASGMKQALLGGLSGVFEMPNTKPSTTTSELLADKVSRAKNSPWVDFAFYVGATTENAHMLPSLEKEDGCCGVKVFMGSSTGTLLVPDDPHLEQILKSGKRRVAIHAEDEALLQQRREFIKAGDPKSHPIWRNEEVALRATQRIVHLAEKCQRPIHVLHVTTKQEMEFLRSHKKWASVETTPQHLTLSSPDCYEKLGTLAQMNPPIRDITHQKALWVGVNDKTVDILGSDHAPHTLEEKNKEYPNSPSGMPGVQTILPLMLNHVNEGNLSLETLCALMAFNPVRLFSIPNRGHIQVGYEATFSIVDMKTEWEIDSDWLKSIVRWSPFEGCKIKGQPKMVYLRGKCSMNDGQMPLSPQGRPFRFT